MPLSASAELPRLVPLFDLPAESAYPLFLNEEAVQDFVARWVDGGTPTLATRDRDAVAAPAVFWSDDGLLCAPANGDANWVDCRDPVRAVPVVHRKRPLNVALPQPTLTIGQATFSKDGSITGGGTFARVSKLRCARSPWLDRKEYRYLPGPQGQLAVLVLEEDDVRGVCARLDAQCGSLGGGPRYWRVLVSIAACPAP